MKNNKLLAQIFFLLSILFIGLLIILTGYYINDYIHLIRNNTLSAIDHLLFDFFYVIGFFPISVLGIISSYLCLKFATSQKIKVITYIESAVFIIVIIFSVILYF